MVPSVTYAIEFARMTTTQLEQLDAIIARVLRRALGLPKHALTKAVLVECGIPFMEVTRHCSLLKFLARFEKLPHIPPTDHPLRVLFHLNQLHEQKAEFLYRPYLREAQEYLDKYGPVYVPSPFSSAFVISKGVLKWMIG